MLHKCRSVSAGCVKVLMACGLLAAVGCGGGHDNDAAPGSGGQPGSGGSVSTGTGGAGAGGAGNSGSGGREVDAGTGGATGPGDGGLPDQGPGVDGGGAGGNPSPGAVYLYASGYGSSTIGIYRLNSNTGALTSVGVATAGSTPTYSVVAPSGKTLYVDEETESASITAFAIGAGGALSKLNTVATGGKGTAHLAVSPDGKWIVAADYDSDSVDVLTLNDDGRVGAVSDSQPGCPAAHNVLFDPSGKFLLAACKSDSGKAAPRILQFSFAAGKLSPSNPAMVMFGADPRHLAFDRGLKHLYVLTEATSQIFWFDYDATTGRVANPQMVSAVPAGGTAGAGGHLGFGGAFLYASNRLDNSIGIFSLDAGGKPQPVGWQKMGADFVREFVFDPAGKHLLTANQNASAVTVFGIDAAGKLTPIGTPTGVKSQVTALAIVGVP